MSKAKSIVSWKIKMDVEWEDGEIEEIDFPEYLADHVDAFLTELEEIKAEENEDE